MGNVPSYGQNFCSLGLLWPKWLIINEIKVLDGLNINTQLILLFKIILKERFDAADDRI